MKLSVFATLFLLVACTRAGDLGEPCKHDGTCNSPNLECVDSPVFLGIPLAHPRCAIKEKQ